jgi:hypothetical protein
MTQMLTQNLPALVVRPNAVPLPSIRVGRPPSTFLAGHPALVATESFYDAKEEIYGESEPAEYVYQVVRGAVRTYKLLNDGRRQIGAFHLPGDVFGPKCPRPNCQFRRQSLRNSPFARPTLKQVEGMLIDLAQ